MSTSRMIRWAAFAAMIAMMAPAPAAAQLGGFLKRKLREKIAQTVIAEATAVQADSGDSSASARIGGNAAGPVMSAPRARKGGPASALFSETTLEMTAEVLDRFEKGLAAEAAERKAIAPELKRLLPQIDFVKCVQTKIAILPEARKAQAEYLKTMQTGRTELFADAMLKFQAELERMAEPVCGLSPIKAAGMQSELEARPAQAAERASGLKTYQFAILKERILPFCMMKGEAAALKELARAPGASYVYSPTEVEALRPRCARIAPALR